MSALSTIVAAGAQTRVGRNPQAGKPMWAYDPATMPPVGLLPNEIASSGYAAILQYVRRRPGPRAPVEFHISPRQLTFDADHGLGDGRFVVDLISAILAVARGDQTPSWVVDDDTRLALPRALMRTFLLHPSRARRACKHATALRAAHALEVGDGVSRESSESVAWSPSFAVAIAHLDANARSAVDQWRRTNTGKAGSAAVWLYIVRQALHAAGLPMRDDVMVAFDCRRYLPPNASANGNFGSGTDLCLSVTDSLSSAVSRLRGCTSSAVHLASMAVLTVGTLLPGRAAHPPPPSVCPVGPRARLVYSDMGRITPFEDLPWRGQGARDHTALLDPGGPDGITVYNTRIGNTRNISISYHDNVFDRCAVQRAAMFLEEPMRFLG